MADELKEFSNLTGKTLTELTNGVTLASTDANKKAVIKNVAVENPSGRSVDLRLNSKTGTKIAGNNSTQTLSGNEILDNSQSLVASTTAELVLNSVDIVGWWEGRLSEGSSSNRYDFTRRKHFGIMSHSTPAGPMFTPDSWDGSLPTTPDVTVDYPKITDMTNTYGYWLEGISDSFFDKDGNMWFWGAGSHGDPERPSTTSGNAAALNNQQLHRVKAGTLANSLTSYGNNSDARIMFYDGSRYIYTGKHNETKLRKYDTHTIGTSNTYTDLNLYDDNSGSTALTLELEPASAGCYYHPMGFAAIYGYGGSNSDGRAFRIIDLSTGRTKALHDYNHSYNDVDGYGGNSNARRSLALCKNSKGELWAVIGNWHNNTNNADARNGWSLTNLGTDPAACLADNGSFVDTRYYHMWGVSGADSQYASWMRHKAGGEGAYFGNPRGFFMHTPNVVGKLYLIGNKYRRSDTDNSHCFWELDMDNITGEWGWMTLKSGSTYKAGCYRAVYDTNKAESGFGSVNFRTTGIEVT